MTKIPFLLLTCLFLAACSDGSPVAANVASAPKPTQPLCEIDDNSIGGIPLGTTLNQVRQLFPNAVLTPSQDADGAILTSIKINDKVEVFASTEQDKDDSPISYLETLSQVCQTPEGVSPEMLVNDVTKKYGAVEQIMLSELEARQTIEFAAQPPELSFRIDDTGIFDEKDKTYPQISTAYQDKARIVSISVMDLPPEDTIASNAK